jgi:integrase
MRSVGDAYHVTADPQPNDLLFPAETGTPFRIGNYLKRIPKPIGENGDIPDLIFQAMRRTFATHFQRYGSQKGAQAHLRHSRLDMTGFYMKEIPGSVRAAVERMDADICKVDDSRPPRQELPVQ